jgi:hypothetical protein
VGVQAGRRISRPIADVVWRQLGVPYLRPELQLLLEAKGLRPKDQQDFDAARPPLRQPPRRGCGSRWQGLTLNFPVALRSPTGLGRAEP